MNSLTPEDPRLTAYALGELPEEERATVEAALAANPALRATVDDIRATATHLEAALAVEPGPSSAAAEAAPLQRAAIVAGRDPSRLDGGDQYRNAGPFGKLFQFPTAYYLLGGLAAAAFAVLVFHTVPVSQVALLKVKDADGDRAVSISGKSAGKAAPAPAESQAFSIQLETAAKIDAAAPALAAPAAPASSPAPVADTLVVSPAHDAEAPKPSAAAGTDQVVTMSPFEVSSSRDEGFQSGSVGSTARIKVDLADTPISYSVINGEFIDALGITNMGEAASWATNQTFRSTDNGGTSNNSGQQYYQRGQVVNEGQGNPAGDQRNSFQNASQTNDSYSIESFDFGSGPNAALFGGVGAPGGLAGISSTQTKNAPAAGGARGGAGGGGGGGGRGGAAGAGGGASGRGQLIGAEKAQTSGWDGQTVSRGTQPSDYGISNEKYAPRVDNRFLSVAKAPLSTFSIDVDTAGYANLRRFLASRQLPPRDAVRVEEMINYFPYHYAAPKTPGSPFAASMEVATAPWDATKRLVRIGIKGAEVTTAERSRANLVFLIDVSGSMNMPNKLPLVKESLVKLLGRLRSDDRVAIVYYADGSGLALPSTPVSESRAIVDAINRLAAGGSTNGAMGIQLAYNVARENFVKGGVNRIVLCTDGDFNVGVTSQNGLMELVQSEAKSNVFLTVLGFGMGNLKDSTLEMLADKGNGNYGYIDSGREADKMLVEQVSGTLVTIAKDVKIQVEFNPAQVVAYRLIGYENRMLKKEDFNNDKVDAGEIGAGHTVTALYEVVPASAATAGTGSFEPVPLVDPLKYQSAGPGAQAAVGGRPAEQSLITSEMLTLKIRYKDPAGDESRKLEFPLTDRGASFAAASTDFRFAAAVAAFGLTLREDFPKASLIADVARWAESALGDDAGGYRNEFLGLVRQAQALVR